MLDDRTRLMRCPRGTSGPDGRWPSSGVPAGPQAGCPWAQLRPPPFPSSHRDWPMASRRRTSITWWPRGMSGSSRWVQPRACEAGLAEVPAAACRARSPRQERTQGRRGLWRVWWGAGRGGPVLGLGEGPVLRPLVLERQTPALCCALSSHLELSPRSVSQADRGVLSSREVHQ